MNHAASVLVVEDDAVLGGLLCDLLRTEGYDARRVEDGNDALRQVEEGHPAVIVLDVMLPGMDGFEVCQRLKFRKETNLIPILMLTALDDTQARRKGLRVGADRYLTKPFEPAELLSEIRSTLDHQRQLREGGIRTSIQFQMHSDSRLREQLNDLLSELILQTPLSQEDIGRIRYAVLEMVQNAVEWGRARGWNSIELRGGRKFLGEAPASLAFYGHHLDLAAPAARLFKRMDGSVRQAVRKAEKEGVTVEVSQSEEAVRAYYDLHCLTRKRHGLPPQPLSFFLNIWRHILSQEQGMVVLAGWRGVKIAGAVYFFLGGRAIYKYGASDFRRQYLRPNNLVMWEAMKWLAWHGLTSLHLGRTSLSNEGLRKFKLNLGAVEQRLEYVKLDLRRNRYAVDAEGIAGWHNRVFRRLPVCLARRAGELLYKHWA